MNIILRDVLIPKGGHLKWQVSFKMSEIETEYIKEEITQKNHAFFKNKLKKFISQIKSNLY